MATSRSRDNRPEGSHVSVLDLQIDWNELFKEPDDPGDTKAEIVEQTGKTPAAIRGWLEREVAAGRLIKGRAIRENFTGGRVIQNVYRPAD